MLLAEGRVFTARAEGSFVLGAAAALGWRAANGCRFQARLCAEKGRNGLTRRRGGDGKAAFICGASCGRSQPAEGEWGNKAAEGKRCLRALWGSAAAPGGEGGVCWHLGVPVGWGGGSLGLGEEGLWGQCCHGGGKGPWGQGHLSLRCRLRGFSWGYPRASSPPPPHIFKPLLSALGPAPPSIATPKMAPGMNTRGLARCDDVMRQRHTQKGGCWIYLPPPRPTFRRWRRRQGALRPFR